MTTPMNPEQIQRVKGLIEQLCELAEWFPKTEYLTGFAEPPNRVQLYQIRNTLNRFAVDATTITVYHTRNWGIDRYHKVETGGYEMSSWLNGLFTKALEDEADALRIALTERRDLIAKAMVAVWAAPLWPFKELWSKQPNLFYATDAWDVDRTKKIRLFTIDDALVKADPSASYDGAKLIGITNNRELAISYRGMTGPAVYRIVDPKNLPDDYLKVIIRAFSAPHRPPGRGEGKWRR